MSRRRQRRPQPTTDARSPEERLEAMIREPNRERALRTFDRILNDLDADPEPGPWLDAARTLRDRLIISENAYCYLGEKLTECVVARSTEIDAELKRIGEAIEAVEEAHGLRDDEYWLVDDGPDEWRELNDAWNRRADALVIARLRELHHDELADLRAERPPEFEQRAEHGRVDLWGDDEEPVD
jgi:hypothetical protein